MTQRKKVIYTAIPKFLVYADPIIGAYVENKGYAVSTPWQYDYGMGDRVDYDDLIESLNSLALNSDEIWVFAEVAELFPHQEKIKYGLGLTDGVVREINLAESENIPVNYFRIECESLDIYPVFVDEKSSFGIER